MSGLLVLLLALSACNEAPERKIEGAVEISDSGLAVPRPPEGSSGRVAPPLTDQEVMDQSGGAGLAHPNVTPEQKSIQRQVVVPKSVEGKWKAVKILIRDKADDEKTKIETVPLGSSFTIGASDIEVAVGSFFPNFVMTEKDITSIDNELGNPAVHLVVTERGTELYRGWIFKNYPTLYRFDHERFGLQLMGSVPAPVS